MACVKIHGQELDVDLEAELGNFEWVRPSWRAGKFQAASPFRHDRTPSFFVSLEGDYAGCWSDSGAYDQDYTSGNFAKLLAFLRNESYEEAEEYLLEMYGVHPEPGAQLTLKLPKLSLARRNRQTLSESVLAGFAQGPCEYLRGRGISDEVQAGAGVLYHDGQRAVVLPWRTASGKLANVKFRKSYGKLFWYAKGGVPISELLWGIDLIHKHNVKTAVLSEAEIDGASWMTAGYFALGNGGVAFNRTKRDLIIRSPIEELIIATDNDKAGEKLRAEVEKELGGYVRVRQAYVRRDCKDANEALVKYGSETLRESVEMAEPAQSLYVNIRTSGRGK